MTLKTILMGCLLLLSSRVMGQEKVVIGSKTYPESRILAEIMAQLIEVKTNLEVERRVRSKRAQSATNLRPGAHAAGDWR